MKILQSIIFLGVRSAPPPTFSFARKTFSSKNLGAASFHLIWEKAYWSITLNYALLSITTIIIHRRFLIFFFSFFFEFFFSSSSQQWQNHHNNYHRDDVIIIFIIGICIYRQDIPIIIKNIVFLFSLPI